MSSDITEDERFVQLQQMLDLPLPDGLPQFVHDEGLERLIALQRSSPDHLDSDIQDFRLWITLIRKCFGFLPSRRFG